MENVNFRILKGGFNHCTDSWNRVFPTGDNSYKIYVITDGHGETIIDGKLYKLEKGNIYFINTHKLEENICLDYIDMYWLHFIPDSLYVDMHLNQLDDVYSWSIDDSSISNFDFNAFTRIFNKTTLGDTFYITSLIFNLLSPILKKKTFQELKYSDYLKLEPAIKHIDRNLDKTLTLDEIASVVFFNKSYFLRLFKKCFGVTPYQYTINSKLNEASSLLIKTSLSIEQISKEVGFCNQFHFSKMFKKHFNIAPTKYRNSKLLP